MNSEALSMNLRIACTALTVAAVSQLISASGALAQEDVADGSLSVLELVTECDILAAHPDDPDRMAEGVADDQIVPRLAIMACEEAFENDQVDPRFAFQLGRAYLQIQRDEDALRLFESAAADGHAAAAGYLGDMYQFGLGGLSVDIEAAKARYLEAVNGGFAIAQNQVSQLTFEPALFMSRTIEDFLKNDLASVAQKSDPLTKSYIFNFADALDTLCGRFMSPNGNIGLYFYRYPDGWDPNSEVGIEFAMQVAFGESDARLFSDRYGCGGVIAERLFANMNSYFSSL